MSECNIEIEIEKTGHCYTHMCLESECLRSRLSDQEKKIAALEKELAEYKGKLAVCIEGNNLREQRAEKAEARIKELEKELEISKEAWQSIGKKPETLTEVANFIRESDIKSSRLYERYIELQAKNEELDKLQKEGWENYQLAYKNVQELQAQNARLREELDKLTAHNGGCPDQCFRCKSEKILSETPSQSLASILQSYRDQIKRLRDIICLILPMAKGWSIDHPIGSNSRYILDAEKVLAETEEKPHEKNNR